ncbi:MAG: Wzz/FepE/Etk N-terminal domain-containing protein [Roseiflexaceae bacterium]
MKPSDYIAIVRRRWWVILLVPVVAALAAYGFSKLQKPVFRAEATYGLTPSRYDNGLSIVLQNSMNSFRDAALAPVQLEKISNQLRIDRSADWLLEHVTIQPRPEDWKMVVQVDYPEDAALAQSLAQAVGDNMMALVGALNARTDSSDKIYMSVQQPARYIGRVRPTTLINTLAGGLLGLILGLLLAFVLESLDNTLKSVADVERFVGLTTLGAIPQAPDERRTRDGPRGIDKRQVTAGKRA